MEHLLAGAVWGRVVKKKRKKKVAVTDGLGQSGLMCQSDPCKMMNLLHVLLIYVG